MEKTKGRISSIQTLGTVDGPGVRFVVFMQGCNLRCGCCHNPETWALSGGTLYTPEELLEKALRYRTYFGKAGGITISGGEPLLQPEFAKELFMLCHENGINTCLDTSGSILSPEVKELLNHTDRVLLDIKYTDNEMYKEYVGCSMETPLKFLGFLNENNIPTTIRQVIIPTLNDNEENIVALSEIVKNHPCVDKTELLPFKKLCTVKYEKQNIDFRFSDFPEPSPSDIEKLYDMMKNMGAYQKGY